MWRDRAGHGEIAAPRGQVTAVQRISFPRAEFIRIWPGWDFSSVARLYLAVWSYSRSQSAAAQTCSNAVGKSENHASELCCAWCGPRAAFRAQYLECAANLRSSPKVRHQHVTTELCDQRFFTMLPAPVPVIASESPSGTAIRRGAASCM